MLICDSHGVSFDLLVVGLLLLCVWARFVTLQAPSSKNNARSYPDRTGPSPPQSCTLKVDASLFISFCVWYYLFFYIAYTVIYAHYYFSIRTDPRHKPHSITPQSSLPPPKTNLIDPKGRLSCPRQVGRARRHECGLPLVASLPPGCRAGLILVARGQPSSQALAKREKK